MRRRLTTVLILSTILLAGWKPTAQAPSTISAADLRAHITALASDKMEGRETGTRGFERAADYVSAEFKRLGLKPVGKSYVEPVRMTRGRVREEATSLTLHLEGTPQTLEYGLDFVSYGSTRTQMLRVEGPLVFAKSGITAPASAHDDYAGVNAAGAIVVASLESPPGLIEADKARFDSLEGRAKNAASHHAAGLLLIDAPGIPWELRARAARQLGATVATADAADSPTLPVMILNAERRKAFLQDAAKGSAVLGLATQLRDVTSENVVGVLTGREVPNEYIAIVAHLDHVGVGVKVDGDDVYNGAVDNASGVAALLTIAKAFTQAAPRRSILFIATTGEEQGEIGSQFFVRHGSVSPFQITAAMNIDGASIIPFNEIEADCEAGSSLCAAAEAAGRQLGVRIKRDSLGGGGSDHAPFLRALIPTIWIQAALPQNWMDRVYHTPKDDLQQPIDFEAMARYAKLNFLVAATVANEFAPYRAR